MRKLLTNTVGVCAILAFSFGCAENPDGSLAGAFSISLLCLAALLAWSYVSLLKREKEDDVQ